MQRVDGVLVTWRKLGLETMTHQTHKRHTMRTRSIDLTRARAHLGLATVALMTVTLAVSGGAQAQAAAGPHVSAPTLVVSVQQIDPTYVDPSQPTGKGLPYLEDLTPDSEADIAQLTELAVGQPAGLTAAAANLPDPEQWDDFRHSVSGAATSSCFGPDALPHEEFAVQGLLRLPFLVRAASEGVCR
jgi:hypothetical protein